MAKYELLADLGYGRVMSYVAGRLHWGRKAGFQERLRTAVNEIVTELANEILKARADASSKAQ